MHFQLTWILEAGLVVAALLDQMLRQARSENHSGPIMRAAESAKTTASRLDRAEESPGSTEQSAR